jgi:hypothetical protein
MIVYDSPGNHPSVRRGSERLVQTMPRETMPAMQHLTIGAVRDSGGEVGIKLCRSLLFVPVAD